jgi:hypothetical protein
MNSVGDAFGFAFRDPAWLGKIIVQSLITIIPIVGWIATYGWLMLTFDNARNGRNELPPAGFHLSRGIGYFGAYAIYLIVLQIPGWILQGAGGSGFHQICNSDNVCTPQYYGGGALAGLGSLWSFLASLLLYFLAPSLIVIVFHSGFSGAFDVSRVWNYATSNVANSVIAGLLMWVAGLIGGLGIFVCCVGLLFTLGYSVSIQAAIAAWFERAQAAPAQPTLPATPAA